MLALFLSGWSFLKAPATQLIAKQQKAGLYKNN